MSTAHDLVIKMALSCYQVFLTVGMLITGSINTLSKKAQNDCNVTGLPDPNNNNTATPHKFDHPWFQTVIMFMGESICLIGLMYERYLQRKALRQQYANELLQSSPADPPPPLPRVFQWILAVPTVCDLFGTTLAGIGLLYVNASVWQMLRGSIIIFTGILSKIFLKRKLRGLHWLGMSVTMIGLVLVGLSSILKDLNNGNNSMDSKVILGILLILGGQLVSASQMILEETFLKKRHFPPLQVVGMEGTFGFFIMSLVVLPVLYFIPGPQIGNRYENSLDALYQIKNDYKLAIFSGLYLLSIAFYNFFGLAVTKSLTAVHRTLIDACRTILVWGVGLIIYYAFDKNFGEPFDKTYGILQVDGFLFLLIGTALYNELMDVPCVECLRKSQPERRPPVQGSIQAADDVEEETRGLLDGLERQKRSSRYS